MHFTLEVLPAREGDCLLLHWGSTADDARLALIDGGPGRTFEDQLIPRLEQIADNQEKDQLILDLVMISHMDSDHVVGIRKLFRRLRKEVEDHIPEDMRLVRVRRLWHNVFNDVLGDSINEYYKQLPTAALASADDGPASEIVEKLAAAFESRQKDSPEAARHNAQDIALILATHNDGRSVRDDHKYLFDNGQIAQLNSPFKDDLGSHTLITTSTAPAPRACLH